MRFAEKGYYIEQYVKCSNCGMLIYGEALEGNHGDHPTVFCSEWCKEWPSLRETWTEAPAADK